MYWGRDINCVHEGNRTFEIIRSNLETALQASGMKCKLWTVLDSGPECTCKKDDSFDVNCASCYGTGIVPGYKQYQNNYFVCDPFRGQRLDETGIIQTVTPVYSSGLLEVSQKWKPNMIGLKDGILSGIITWTLTLPPNTYIDASYDTKVFVRDSDKGSSSVDVTVSFNSVGPVFVPISTITGTTLNSLFNVIRIRATLTRSSVDVRTPLLEVVRIKGKAVVPDHILMSRTRNPSDLNFEKHGIVDREGPVGLWTVQDFIIRPTLSERQRGSMIEMVDSPFATLRYELFNPVQSFWKDHTFRQVFEARVISRDREIFWKIF